MPFVLLSETPAVSNVSETLVTAFQTALQGVQTDYQSMVTVALPIALGIFAVGYAIRAGIGFFRSVAH